MHRVLGDADADRYLDALIRGAVSCLGDRFVGGWLIGSAARGDYLAGRSDLDVTLAVSEPLDPATKRSLADALRHDRLPCPAPKLELVVYRRDVLAAPGRRPRWELNLNTGPAVDEHVGTDPMAEPAHWFILDLAAARDGSVPLLGPRLADLLGTIPDADVAAALRDSLAWHAANDADGVHLVLNGCRAWHWLETGRWSSKSEAAAWAIAGGGDAGLIGLALERRRGRTDATLPSEGLARFRADLDGRLAAASHT